MLSTLLVDAAIALVLAILVIIISPGLAVVGLAALLVVLICVASFALDRRRKRRRQNPVSELRHSRRVEARAVRPGRASAGRDRPAGRERREPRRR